MGCWKLASIVLHRVKKSSKKNLGEVEQLLVVKGLERRMTGEAGGSFVPD